MVTDESYTGGEHHITYRVVESLGCIPETNVLLCANYASIKNKLKNKEVKLILQDMFFCFLLFLWLSF